MDRKENTRRDSYRRPHRNFKRPHNQRLGIIDETVDLVLRILRATSTDLHLSSKRTVEERHSQPSDCKATRIQNDLTKLKKRLGKILPKVESTAKNTLLSILNDPNQHQHLLEDPLPCARTKLKQQISQLNSAFEALLSAKLKSPPKHTQELTSSLDIQSIDNYLQSKWYK